MLAARLSFACKLSHAHMSLRLRSLVPLFLIRKLSEKSAMVTADDLQFVGEQDMHKYSEVITSFCSNNNISAARSVMDMMFARGIRPMREDFETLLKAYSGKGDTTSVNQVIKFMKACELQPDVHALRHVLVANSVNGKLTAAERHLETMLISGVKPDAGCYNIILRGWAKQGNCTRALSFFKQIPDHIPRTLGMYSALVRAFCTAGKMEAADQVVRHMVASGLTIDTVLNTILLRGWGQLRRVDMASQVFESMRTSGQLDAVAANTMIEIYCNDRQFDKAKQITLQMRELGIEPTARTLQHLAQGATSLAAIQELREFLIQQGMDASISCPLRMFEVAPRSLRIQYYISAGLPLPKPSCLFSVDLHGLSCKQAVTFMILHLDLLHGSSTQSGSLRIITGHGQKRAAGYSRLQHAMVELFNTLLGRNVVSTGTSGELRIEHDILRELLDKWPQVREQWMNAEESIQ